MKKIMKSNKMQREIFVVGYVESFSITSEEIQNAVGLSKSYSMSQHTAILLVKLCQY